MPASAPKKTPAPRRRGRAGKESSTRRGEVDEARIEAGRAFNPATRLRVRGLNVLAQAAVQEKEKVSLTLDKHLVEEIRSQFGGRALSTSINELLCAALAQARLGELVDEMEQEAGPPSPEGYERVLAQWFAED